MSLTNERVLELEQVIREQVREIRALAFRLDEYYNERAHKIATTLARELPEWEEEEEDSD